MEGQGDDGTEVFNAKREMEGPVSCDSQVGKSRLWNREPSGQM